MPGRRQRILAISGLVLVSVMTIAMLVRGLQRAAGAETTPAHSSRRTMPQRPGSVTLNWVGDIALSTEHGLPRRDFSSRWRRSRACCTTVM
jgi:hypothetical protein